MNFIWNIYIVVCTCIFPYVSWSSYQLIYKHSQKHTWPNFQRARFVYINPSLQDISIFSASLQEKGILISNTTSVILAIYIWEPSSVNMTFGRWSLFVDVFPWQSIECCCFQPDYAFFFPLLTYTFNRSSIKYFNIHHLLK